MISTRMDLGDDSCVRCNGRVGFPETPPDAANKLRPGARGVYSPPTILYLRLLLPGDRLPATVDQPLHRLELDLVGHLAALRDPVAEVEVGDIEPAAELDLPQDVGGAEAGAAYDGLEEGVDRGQSVI